MKLKCSLENIELDDELIAIPVGNGAENLHAMLRINETASDILALLQEETTEEEVIREMLKIYNTDEATMKKSVHAFIEKLSAAGVLA